MDHQGPIASYKHLKGESIFQARDKRHTSEREIRGTGCIKKDSCLPVGDKTKNASGLWELREAPR